MTFPNNVNGMCEYSIIEIRCLPYNSETIKFQNDFVLICSTYLNKNDKAHGHTTFEMQSEKNYLIIIHTLKKQKSLHSKVVL